VAGGDFAHKSSDTLLFLKLENADEKNIVSINRRLGGSTSSSLFGSGQESTSLDSSQETEGSQSSGNYSARNRHSGQGDGGHANSGGADGDGGESRTAKQDKAERAAKEEARKKPVKWDCSACGWKNFPGASECDKCGAPRD